MLSNEVDIKSGRVVTTKDAKSRYKTVIVELSDPEGSLERFLEKLRYLANPGHSFEVVLDPDGDKTEKVGFDGDGPFGIYNIKVKDADVKDFTINDIGKHNDIEDESFDQEQLVKGIKVEMEHTDSEEIAKAIAKDHLFELPDYYIRLKKMEEGK